jgi:hypothetical protein
MGAFDSQPKVPLPFAATLHDIDLNLQSSRSPPIRRKDLPKAYLPPACSPIRNGTSSSLGAIDRLALTTSHVNSEVGSDEWMASEVGHCVDSAIGVLNLK